MYGQMTAGTWINIGTPGHRSGHLRDVREAGREHSAATSRGRWVLTAGLGGRGGAQPLAATMAGARSSRWSATKTEPISASHTLPRPPRTHDPRRGPRDHDDGHGQAASRSSATPPRSSPIVCSRRPPQRVDRPDQRPRPPPRLPARSAGPSRSGPSRQTGKAIPKSGRKSRSPIDENSTSGRYGRFSSG